MSKSALDKLPEEFRCVIFDFVLNCLLDKPQDYIEHGYQYFGALLAFKAESKLIKSEKAVDDESVQPTFNNSRRASVVSESCSPYGEEESSDVELGVPKTDDERTKLANYLDKMVISRNLDLNVRDKIIDVVKSKSVKAGEIIVNQGDDFADSVYLIQEGFFEVTVKTDSGEEVVRRLEDTGSFCNLAIYYCTPIKFTVRALTDGKLWVLERLAFRKIVVKGAYSKTNTYQKMIEDTQFLRGIDPLNKLNLSDALSIKHFRDGDVIFEEGDTANGMYFIVSGRVTLTVDHPLHGKTKLAELNPGNSIGELSLLTDNPYRVVSAYASGESELAFLDSNAFYRLLGPSADKICNYYKEET